MQERNMESSNITNEIDDDYEVMVVDSDATLTSQAETNTTAERSLVPDPLARSCPVPV